MYQRILVPVDGSSTSTHGLEEAIRLARVTGAELRLVHVLHELDVVAALATGGSYLTDVLPMLKNTGERMLKAGRERAAAAGVKAEAELVECLAGRIADIVMEQAKAWDAELIVLGTHGRRGVSRWMLGSDAEQIMRRAAMPVLLVPAASAPGET